MAGRVSGGGTVPTEAFATLSEVARGLSQEALADSIDRTAKALARHELTVAVLGQFKRGKSTLLNALLGREVLPSGILPTTSTAISVREGPGEMRVTDGSGSAVELPPERVHEYVTEAENPGNRRGVRSVELRVPLPSWAHGVTFLDSPGVGSVVAENTAAARSVLPGVDAAIYVLSPEPPLTENDLGFLRDAAEHATKFFFVLNKADLLPPDERETLRAYTETVLRERCGFGEVRIFSLSARGALRAATANDPVALNASGVPAFVRSLESYLTTGRARAVAEAARRRVGLYAARLREVLDLSLRSARLSEKEYQEKSGALERGVADLRREQRAADGVLDSEVRALFEETDERLARFRASERAPLVAALEEFLDAGSGALGAGVAQGFDERFRDRLGPRVAALRADLTERLAAGLGESFRRYEERLRHSLESFQRTAAGLFDLRLTPVAAEVELTDSTRYLAGISRLFESTLAGQTLLLLPGAVLRRGLRRRLPAVVEEELDRQSGRIRGDLVERTSESIRGFRAETDRKVAVDVEAIRTALGRGAERHSLARAEADAWDRTQARWSARLNEVELLVRTDPS